MIVFLSYAKEDVARVRDSYALLKASGYTPWMDEYNILPGQDWKYELQSAIATCDAAILFISQQSVLKTGYVQAELSEFLEQSKLRPEGAIYLIAARLDACDIPRSLSGLHYVNLFEESGFQRILKALEHAGGQQSLVRRVGEARGEFTVLTKVVEESWEGLPGYSANLKYPELHGGACASSCEEINLLFRAECLSRLYHIRSSRINQNPALFANAGHIIATNKEIVEYKITFISATAISILFNIIGYGAGGAHGYSKYKTKNFLLTPARELPLGAFFANYNYAEKLGLEAREALRKKAWERNTITLDERQLTEGTSRLHPWDNPEFTFDENGLTLYFQEYQIGPYAIGRWEVTLQFDNLREILRPDGLRQLLGVP